MNLGNGYEVPVIQKNLGGSVPKACVFIDEGRRPLTPAEAKRARFVQNLKENYQRLKEALVFVEHFAKICELSEAKIEAIRKAKDEALDELSVKFDEKLKAYDERIGRPAP